MAAAIAVIIGSVFGVEVEHVDRFGDMVEVMVVVLVKHARQSTIVVVPHHVWHRFSRGEESLPEEL